MADATIILQLHLPYVLSKYDALSPGPIVDQSATRLACQRFAARSIEPVNEVLTEIAVELGERFRATCLVSGLALEILAKYQPDVITSLKRLADAGVIDFAVTPYYHGLSCLVDTQEFVQQVDDTRAAVRRQFGCDSFTMANTAMLYNDRIGELVSQRGVGTVICNPKSNDYAGPTDNVDAGILRGVNGMGVVMFDSSMSRLVSNRFDWMDEANSPLTAPNFAMMLADRARIGGHRTLIWDYRTFGERFAPESGVFAFLRHLPSQLLDHGFGGFQYCCDAVTGSGAGHESEFTHAHERDEYRPRQFEGVSVEGSGAIELLGDPQISHAHTRLYSLKDKVLRCESDEMIQDWRRLQAWDYMRRIGATESASDSRWWINGANSGYEYYVMFMGHCDALASRIAG